MPMIGFTALFAWTYALKSINSSNIKDSWGKSIKSWKITDSSCLKLCLRNVLRLILWQIPAWFIIERTPGEWKLKDIKLIATAQDINTDIFLGHI